MKTKRIKATNIQPSLGLAGMAFWWLFLDHFKANDVFFGIYYCLCGLNIIAVIYSWFTDEVIDIFKEEKK